MKEVWLAIPVQVSEGVDVDSVDLAGYLSRFIDVGFSDLSDSVEDEEIDSDESDEVVANKTHWGEPVVLPCKPIGIE